MTDAAGRWVLVIDDDDDIREILETILTAQGWPTVGARDGVDALEKLAGGGAPPAVILLDLMMPRLDGAAFVKELRARPGMEDVPIVVMSGDGSSRMTAALIGATEHLQKPVELDELLNVVRSHL
jgi:DNA-binding response OmpR family regulator